MMETENLILKIYQETGVWVPDGKQEISESWFRTRRNDAVPVPQHERGE